MLQKSHNVNKNVIIIYPQLNQNAYGTKKIENSKLFWNIQDYKS